MPRPVSRLDLFVVPDQPDRTVDDAAVRALGQVSGWWGADGAPGPQAAALGTDGFRLARIERHDRAVLYANQQGGFRVRCPACATGIVPGFTRLIASWRAGGDRVVTCAACGWSGGAEDCITEPPARLATAAVHLSHVGAAHVAHDALVAIAAHWGPVVVVGRRTSP